MMEISGGVSFDVCERERVLVLSVLMRNEEFSFTTATP